MKDSIFAILITIVICWIYYIQYRKIECPKIPLEEASPFFKTGDMIIFKACNNFNSIFHGGYYGHVGIVILIDDVPYIFEANGIEKCYVKPSHNKNGIFLTPLINRINKYKGIAYWKPLNKIVPEENMINFKRFISFAMEKMYYDYAIFDNFFKKILHIQGITKGTNCAEISFLSLISLGILNTDHLDACKYHYLNYITNINIMDNGYEYNHQFELLDHPFAD